MIIRCPNCSTRYAVAESSLGEAGRRVKCARCAHVWFQIRPEEPEEVLDFVEPPFTADIPDYSNLPAPPRTVPSLITRLWYGAALCSLLLISGTAALLGYPKPVIEYWPPAARFYMTLGMPIPVPGRGLTLTNVVVNVFNQENASALLVSGIITNTLPETVTVPTLHMLARDENRTVILEWLDKAPTATLAPGQSVTFYTQQLSQDTKARNLQVTFTNHVVPERTL